MARRFPPSVGGMERFAYDLSNALGEKIEVKKITWGGSNKWLPLVLPLFFVKGFWALLTDRNINIIHMHDAVQAPIGWLLHVIFRKPYAVVAHGLDITYSSKIYQVVILPFVRRADVVIANSSATLSEARQRGVKPEKSMVITLGAHDDFGTVVPNRKLLAERIGVDLGNKKLLLTTGRLVKRKGVAWFITHVLPSTVQNDNSVLYLVAGEGSEREAIEQATSESGMSGHVVLLGRVSDEARSLLYQSCDVFVMPNIPIKGDMEGFGIVAHEAATAELPVVASNLEGIADALKHEKNGILVEAGNAGAFATEINKLLSDGELRHAFGRRAREYTLKEYGWDKVANSYVEVYRSLIDEERNGRKDLSA
jgi:phosphatidylinositol alpha-1,6-mannosyltransferase